MELKMDVIITFVLLFNVIQMVNSLDICTDRDVKLALQSCDNFLSEISTFILQTPNNGTYSEACR